MKKIFSERLEFNKYTSWMKGFIDNSWSSNHSLTVVLWLNCYHVRLGLFECFASHGGILLSADSDCANSNDRALNITFAQFFFLILLGGYSTNTMKLMSLFMFVQFH